MTVMEKEQYLLAENYWKQYDATSAKMTSDAIYKAADAFLAAHNTCVLGTACNDLVRCTPIEYNWMDGCFYLLSEGGMKFHALYVNKRVSMAVFEPYKGFEDLSSIQISGEAEVLESGCPEYSKVLTFKRIPAEAMKKLSHPMYLIKITPKKMELLFSDFKKNGFDSRQQIIL
jgi:Predicted flavin-nucleotide-binding protein